MSHPIWRSGPRLTSETDKIGRAPKIVAGGGRVPFLMFVTAGVLALGAVAGTIWLQRKITPPLLTRDNAASVYETPEHPGQPDGAPPG